MKTTSKPQRNRDRAYWDPPQGAIGRIEGHIEEIEPGDAAPAPPVPQRGPVGTTLRSRRVQSGLAAACVVLVAGAVTIGPFAARDARAPQPAQSSGPGVAAASPDGSNLPPASPSFGSPSTSIATTGLSPTPSPTPTPWAVPTWMLGLPTEAPTETPADPTQPAEEPDPTPSFSKKGWPLELESATVRDSTPESAIGPDGTLYVETFPGFDKSGHARAHWLNVPDETHEVPVAFGADGTTYVEDYLDDQNGLPDLLYAFDSTGKLRAGWPADVVAGSWYVPGPSGTLYVVDESNADSTIVTVLSPKGQRKAQWSIASPGSSCGAVVRPDGVMFFAYGPSDGSEDCAVRTYSPSGTLLSRAPTRGWNGVAMAPDGTVVAWGYDLQPFGGGAIAQPRVALLGTDGQPTGGWPVTIEGEASEPVFGANGSIYLSVLGLGTSPCKVVALDRTGRVRDGWPVALPTGFGPMLDDTGNPQPPVSGADGEIYVEAVDTNLMGYVTAFDATGAVIPGWPYRLPQAFSNFDGGDSRISTANPGPMFVRSASGSGLLYLVLDDRIVALGADGKVAPGWPYVLSGRYDGAAWFAAMGTPDGGLVAIASATGKLSDGDTFDYWVAFRWTAAGKAPR